LPTQEQSWILTPSPDDVYDADSGDDDVDDEEAVHTNGFGGFKAWAEANPQSPAMLAVKAFVTACGTAAGKPAGSSPASVYFFHTVVEMCRKASNPNYHGPLVREGSNVLFDGLANKEVWSFVASDLKSALSKVQFDSAAAADLMTSTKLELKPVLDGHHSIASGNVGVLEQHDNDEMNHIVAMRNHDYAHRKRWDDDRPQAEVDEDPHSAKKPGVKHYVIPVAHVQRPEQWKRDMPQWGTWGDLDRQRSLLKQPSIAEEPGHLDGDQFVTELSGIDPCDYELDAGRLSTPTEADLDILVELHRARMVENVDSTAPKGSFTQFTPPTAEQGAKYPGYCPATQSVALHVLESEDLNSDAVQGGIMESMRRRVLPVLSNISVATTSVAFTAVAGSPTVDATTSITSVPITVTAVGTEGAAICVMLSTTVHGHFDDDGAFMLPVRPGEPVTVRFFPDFDDFDTSAMQPELNQYIGVTHGGLSVGPTDAMLKEIGMDRKDMPPASLKEHWIMLDEFRHLAAVGVTIGQDGKPGHAAFKYARHLLKLYAQKINVVGKWLHDLRGLARRYFYNSIKVEISDWHRGV